MAGFFGKLSKRLTGCAREDHGGIAIVYALSFSVTAGFAALGIEVGDVYVARHVMKNAADAAAFAVAVAGAGTEDTDFLRDVAYQAARNAGFTGTADAIAVQRPDAAFAEQLPDTPLPGSADSLRDRVLAGGWQVTITQRKELVLAALVGGSGHAIDLAVVSVAGAGNIGTPTPRCLVGLETTDDIAAVRTNGAAFSLTDGCGIHANSDMVVNGNNKSVGGRPISVTGDFISGAVEPEQLTLNARTYPDPFAENTAIRDFDPDSHSCNYNNQRPSSPVTYDATGESDRTIVFCGNTDFRADAHFVGPAVYVFKDGFDISNATVSGTDVVFILADMSPDAVRVTGNGALDLVAPRKAVVEALPYDARTIMEPWIGIALFGDEETFAGGTAFKLETATFAGTFSFRVDGAMYTPGAGLDIRGNVSGTVDDASGTPVKCTRIIARQVEVSGSVAVAAADCRNLFGDAVNDLVLLQPRLYY